VLKKAVFLDRDGVINKKRDDYVKNVSEFVILPDVSQAIKLLNEKKYLVIIITNQSAINRGIITHDILAGIHEFMKGKLGKEGAVVDAIYYCPHRPDENCSCRKPATGLIERAIGDHSISTDSSWFVGDSESDMLAAAKLGIKAVRMEQDASLLEAISEILEDLD
jgi:histidinol-phosphate phosphatase family protein